ncbi:hypothetical protein Pan44_02310 [Caulifigura coniformis]|uniref:Carboxypeptidase regulatory-like domain-containing protein n=1 Tax=Caulifigura coniformis TaxID=2527983 RepID=A0A517S7Y1_9PLAN|nr:carboxypeptidase-like regulatory domain-containing protein [Caulifigura coniformis]QDT52222.1 hypothetical protein Pan44_02310 [Caulifigura coniformis]
MTTRLRFIAFLLAGLLLESPNAHALITGGEGNQPVRNRPDWPAGAADVANQQSRIAWWEGPPFGGGEWHFEYRGDADALNDALKRLAAIQGQRPRLIIRDGRATSFWLGIRADGKEPPVMDWTFVVWEAANYERLFGTNASRFMARSPNYGKPLPPPELTVYTGNGLDWSKVNVPEGIDVVDERLTAHGYRPEDGAVIEVSVRDLISGAPLKAAELVIERRPAVNPADLSELEVTRAESNAAGQITLKGLPRESLTLKIRRPGYVARTIDYTNTEQNLWKRYDVELAEGHRVSGRVVDDQGKPVANVTVRLTEFLTPKGTPYAWLDSLSAATTDSEGRFVIEAVPAGSARYYAYSDQYVTVGLGEILETSDKSVTLKVSAAGQMKVTVKGAKGPYIVNVAPEGGEKVGSWGGSSQLGEDGACRFTQIPPGRYVVHARPNPGTEAQRTKDVTVDIKPLKTVEVELKAVP